MVTTHDPGPFGASSVDGQKPQLPSVGPRYQIVRRIKRGGMAEVFEAYLQGERGFRKRFAIKRPLEISDPRNVERFADEARILSQLTHPNIVQVYDLGIQQGWPYQVLEYVDGASLIELYSKSRIRRSPMPEAVALHIAEVVATALHHAHTARDDQGRSLGIIHRDISPENILISWKGQVKLIDFGIAFAERKEAKTQTGIVQGKLSYMAPEQLYGEPISPRTDIFALGCVLHAMILGKSPLVESKARADIGSGKLPQLDLSLPKDIRALIERAIQPKPEERFRDASSTASACQRALEQRRVKDPQELLNEWLLTIVPKRVEPKASPFVELFELDGPSALDDGLSTILDPQIADRSTKVAQEPAELTRPLTIGRFELLKVLGPAGLGTLYLARDMKREGARPFILKTVPRHALERDELISMFFAEAAIFSHIEHDGFLKVFDFGTEANYAYMALEQPPGQSLQERLQTQGPLTWAQASVLGAQLLRALAQVGQMECDGFDLFQRDVRAQTVLIDGSQTPRLFDYALVSVAERRAAQVEPPRPLQALCACLIGAIEGAEVDPEAPPLERLPDLQLAAMLKVALEQDRPDLVAIAEAFERQIARSPESPKLSDLETQLQPEAEEASAPHTPTQTILTSEDAPSSGRVFIGLGVLLLLGLLAAIGYTFI